MKKKLLLFWLMVCLARVCAQSFDHTHNLVAWGNVGYDRVSNKSLETFSPGGMGTDVGLGYEFHYKKFILQTGLDLQGLFSVMQYKDISHVVPMLDTEGRPFDGIFEMQNNREHQTLNNITIPLLLGFSYYDVYFLAGGKFQFNFNNRISTSSDVTSKARYNNIIGSDGGGLLTDMPNHDLKTVNQTVEGSLDLSPIYALSFEVGKKFTPPVRKKAGTARREYYRQQKESENRFKKQTFSRHYYRLAFFCDYGFTSLKENNQPGMIINTATQPRAYSPALNHMLYSEKDARLLYAGLKFTILFEFPSKYPCYCY